MNQYEQEKVVDLEIKLKELGGISEYETRIFDYVNSGDRISLIRRDSFIKCKRIINENLASQNGIVRVNIERVKQAIGETDDTNSEGFLIYKKVLKFIEYAYEISESSAIDL